MYRCDIGQVHFDSLAIGTSSYNTNVYPNANTNPDTNAKTYTNANTDTNTDTALIL